MKGLHKGQGCSKKITSVQGMLYLSEKIREERAVKTLKTQIFKNKWRYY